ncbi:DUF1178 family protein [Rhodoblastus sp.]|uniref:DUF1178 family protein n=1 Tax=Rhodoblastus sp. TaxID=1962975 RepID=UPI002625C796|nr:DUF1178 family protein [Rhodoblastus sp.]
MIRFALVCANGHEFESWFASNESYDFQIANKLVSCPYCNGTDIAKAVMAPAVARAVGVPAKAPKQNVALLGAADRGLRDMARELHQKIVAATVDVGAEFAREARRIHDGEAPERPIRGQTSPEEARALLDDGVEIMPMPATPEDLG